MSLGEAHIVMRREQQAGSVSLQPLPDGGDLLRRGGLLGYQMVEAENHQGIRVRQNPFVYRQLVSGLVDALEHGNRMTGSLTCQLLEGECGAVEELQRARDALEEVHRIPFRSLISPAMRPA